MERLIWLASLSGASGISETDDQDIWLTSCLKGASDISETGDRDIWFTSCPEWSWWH
jgi:hypothetical protein